MARLASALQHVEVERPSLAHAGGRLNRYFDPPTAGRRHFERVRLRLTRTGLGIAGSRDIRRETDGRRRGRPGLEPHRRSASSHVFRRNHPGGQQRSVGADQPHRRRRGPHPTTTPRSVLQRQEVLDLSRSGAPGDLCELAGELKAGAGRKLRRRRLRHGSGRRDGVCLDDRHRLRAAAAAGAQRDERQCCCAPTAKAHESQRLAGVAVGPEAERAPLAHARGRIQRRVHHAPTGRCHLERVCSRLTSARLRVSRARDVGRETRLSHRRSAGLEQEPYRASGAPGSDVRRQSCPACPEQSRPGNAVERARSVRGVLHLELVLDLARSGAAGHLLERAREVRSGTWLGRRCRPRRRHRLDRRHRVRAGDGDPIAAGEPATCGRQRDCGEDQSCSSASSSQARTPSIGSRSWASESRSRTVTVSSSSVCSSTVKAHGVPISS